MTSERADQPATPDMHGIPGKTLAAQREAMGWSVEQVADQLKLAVRQVTALEAGDYASLPSPAVTRGFVRAYAKILRLDPAPLVAMIEMDTPPPAESGALRRDRPASFSERRFSTRSKRSALPLRWIAAAVLVVAAGAAAWQFGLIPGSLSGRDGAGAGTSVLPAPVAAPGGAAPAMGGADGTTQDTLQSPAVPLISVPPPPPAAGAAPVTVGTPAGVNGVAPATTPAPAAAAAAPAGANALVINVREDSWVEVRPGKGRPLLSRLVRAGSTETIEVTEPVTLVVGKPGAVTATWRGAAVDLPQSPGKTTARVSLK